ncbi:pyridoxal phosphate-dependent transferase [Chiua virens]|nr:pyridoxal phosphate-dependent transferase [Chiua virens]
MTVGKTSSHHDSVTDTTVYEQPPPPFGHATRALFGFSPNYVSLNNGSYGALPLPVRAYCDKLTDQIESNPDKFIKIDYIHHLNRVRQRVAKLVGAETDECVIVNNTSHGIATILHNFTFNEGDVLVGTTTTYGAVSQMLKYLADLPPHPTSVDEHIKQLTNTDHTIAREDRKIFALIDSVASNPGVLLPWKEMVAICRKAGVISLVDGAQSIGQELDINLSEGQPDFWVSVCSLVLLSGYRYKHLFSKELPQMAFFEEGKCRSLCSKKVYLMFTFHGLLKTHLGKHRNQHLIKSPFPTPVTYNSPHDDGYKGPQDFVTLFDWTGTIDYVPHLSIGAAMDFREWLGGEHKINEYTHALALAGGKHLAERLGTSALDPDGEFTLNMVNVELPLPADIEPSNEIHQIFLDTLLIQWQTFVPEFKHNGRWWVRCSAQIWNEISDFDVIANALKDACDKVKELAVKQESEVESEED